MTRYLLLLAGDEALGPFPGTPAFDAEMEGYVHFEQVAGAAVLASEALEPVAAGHTARPGAGGGAAVVTAGPFAELTEVVGGLYVLEAADLDEAVDLARLIPAAAAGAIELRPLVEWLDRGDGPSGSAEEPRHVALLWGPETSSEVPGTPEWDAGAAEHGRFTDLAGDVVRAGGALHPSATATTIRVRDGELLVTDGPFAELAEVVGGVYLFHPTTTEEATALAAAIPVNAGGGVELRPVMETG